MSFLVVSLLSLLGTKSHRNGGYSHDSSCGAFNPTWMARINDTSLLHRINIPGTHDTMARFGGDAYECNTMSLQKQLESGIRFIDIRADTSPSGYSYTWGIYHGTEGLLIGNNFQHADLDADVFAVIESFLNDYPSETIIMRLNLNEAGHVIELSGPDKCIRYDIFKNGLFQTYKHIIHNVRNNVNRMFPTVGEMRGKIYLMTWTEWSVCDENFAVNFYGDNVDKEDSATLGTNWDLYSKWVQKKDHFNKARNFNIEKFFYTNLAGNGVFPYFVASGHSNPATGAPRLATGRTTPGWSSWGDFPRVNCFLGICTIAFEGLNVLSLEYMQDVQEPQRFYGIIGMDFPGYAIINAIIFSNDLIETHDKMHCGHYGEFIECNSGIMTGACGSGRDANCNDFHNQCRAQKWSAILCDYKELGNADLKSSWQCAKYGVRQSCEDMLNHEINIMVGLCGSGENADCKSECSSDSYAAIRCAKQDGKGVRFAGNVCVWIPQYEWGRFTECPSGFVITGYCGSGRNRDCNGNAFEIQCCRLGDAIVGCGDEITEDIDHLVFADVDCSSFSDYINNWDGFLDAKRVGHYFSGMMSTFDDGKNDRKFKFRYCGVQEGISPESQWFPETVHDKYWERGCGGNTAITRLKSSHNDDAEDRKWEMKCNALPSGYRMTECTIPSYVNEYKEDVNYRCPDKGIIRTIYSRHDNTQEDRQWGFECCRIVSDAYQYAQIHSNWRNYENEYEETFDNRWNGNNGMKKYFCGLQSSHNNHKEDRIFKWKKCNVDDDNFIEDIFVLDWTPFEDKWTRSCGCNDESPNMAMMGVKSIFIDDENDRKWRFQCGVLSAGYMTVSCGWSGYLNEYDGDVDFQCLSNGIIRSISSVYNDHKRDRIWKFECCQIFFEIASSGASAGEDYMLNIDTSVHHNYNNKKIFLLIDKRLVIAVIGFIFVIIVMTYAGICWKRMFWKPANKYKVVKVTDVEEDTEDMVMDQ
eukprot:55454_1